MALPILSDEARAAALQKAVAARRARADLKAAIKSGEITPEQLLERAQVDDIAGKLTVVHFLRSVPRVGPVSAKAIMDELDIAENRKVKGLGLNQQNAIIEKLKVFKP